MSQIKSNPSKPLANTAKSTHSQTPGSKAPSRDSKSPAPVKNGFDPYNSGVFDARRTWEKVIRK